MKKIKSFFLLAPIILIFIISLIYAQGSYQIKDNQIIFTLSSSEGIYDKAQILQDSQKIADIQLCDTDRCLKTIIVPFNLTDGMSGNYQLAYYLYDSYKWEKLDFAVGSIDQDNIPAQQDSVVSSSAKAGLVKFICRIHTLFNGKYQECLNEYL